jgi:hypothetical protein
MVEEIRHMQLRKRTHKRHITCFQTLKSCQMEKELGSVAPAGGSCREAYFGLI